MVGDHIVRNGANGCSSFFPILLASPVLCKMGTRKNLGGIVKVAPVLLYVPLIFRSVPFKMHVVCSNFVHTIAQPRYVIRVSNLKIEGLQKYIQRYIRRVSPPPSIVPRCVKGLP